MTAEEHAWDAFEKHRHHRAVRALINADVHKNFYFVNPITHAVEPTHRRTVHFLKREVNSRRGIPLEVHKLKINPAQRAMDQSRLDALSRTHDPLYDVPGARGSLGRFISMKTQPAATDVVIRRAVQKKAVRILAEHVLRQHAVNRTAIYTKRSNKGRFTFTVFASPKYLDNVVVADLTAKLLKAAKSRKKYLHIVIRPSRPGGQLHDIVKSNFTLL